MSRISQRVLSQYLETALWSSCDDGDSLDATYDIDSFDAAALETAARELADFFDMCADDIEASGADDEQTAHDFWLTRNGHGAGFWDRGYPNGIGERLSAAAKTFGSCDVIQLSLESVTLS